MAGHSLGEYSALVCPVHSISGRPWTVQLAVKMRRCRRGRCDGGDPRHDDAEVEAACRRRAGRNVQAANFNQMHRGYGWRCRSRDRVAKAKVRSAIKLPVSASHSLMQ
jgi:malonyl CoA-acyl carrier protein transacylase